MADDLFAVADDGDLVAVAPTDVKEDLFAPDAGAKESGAEIAGERKEGEEGKPEKPGLLVKIEGEDWVDFEMSDAPPKPKPAAPPLKEKEGETAGAKEEEVEAKEETKKEEKEADTPMKSFIPSLFKIKKKFREKQVEGGTGTKRKPMVKYDADKAYEVQYKVHTAHHEFDDKKPEQILDLCLIMDCTGSMGSWIQHCKETLHKVIDATVARDPECKVRTAFVGYRDFCDKNALFELHDFSYDADKVKDFINNVEAKGGGDFPEDIHGGIRKALDLSWSSFDDSVKLAVLIADAPTHGKKYHVGHQHDDFPDGNPAGLVLEDLMKEMSDKEILVSLYQLNNHNEVMYKAMKEAYSKGEEQDGVEYVDMRDIQPAQAKMMPGSSPMMMAGSPPMMMATSSPMMMAGPPMPGSGPPPSMMASPMMMAGPPMPGACPPPSMMAERGGFGGVSSMFSYEEESAPPRSTFAESLDIERSTYASLSSATIERQCSKMRSSSRKLKKKKIKSGW